jgi:uncharacterized protein
MTRNELSIDIDRLRDRALTVDYDFPALELEADDDEFRFPGQVTGQVTLLRAGDEVVAHGTLRTEGVGTCARCLEEAHVMLEAAVEERWVRRLADHPRTAREDEDLEPDVAYVIDGDRIHLAEVFREVLLAELPDRLICREDCKGICPACGANLNKGRCDCAKGESADGGKQSAGSENPTAISWKDQLRGIHLDSD